MVRLRDADHRRDPVNRTLRRSRIKHAASVGQACGLTTAKDAASSPSGHRPALQLKTVKCKFPFGKKSSPPTSLSPEGNLASPPGNPLLAPAPVKKSSGRPLAPIASVAMVAVAIVVSIFLLVGHKQKFVHSAAELAPEPDPPVAAPAAKEFVHPAADELPGATDLSKDALALTTAATQIPSDEDLFVGNGRAKRWEIRFPSGNTAETYSRLLDGLRVELGLIGGGDKITYVSGFTKAKPAVREKGPARGLSGGST